MNFIIGAGGVASEILWMLSRHGREGGAVLVVKSEDEIPAFQFKGMPVISELSMIRRLENAPGNVYIGIGDPAARRRIHGSMHGLQCDFPSLVDATACFDTREGRVSIGKGTIIYPSASMTTEISVGDFVQINPNSCIGHNSSIGDYTTICPGAIISGYTKIGRECFIGAGAIVKESLSIADGITVGAGAVVLNDLSDPGTYIGTPAKRMEPR